MRIAANFLQNKILESCPDISKTTVERTLTNSVKSGYIVKTGSKPAMSESK